MTSNGIEGEAARGMGLERYDFSVVYEVFRALNGLGGQRELGQS